LPTTGLVGGCGIGLSRLVDAITVISPASLPAGLTFTRHCEPTGRANARPMTGSAKQSIVPQKER
jgi:hypothetical protein